MAATTRHIVVWTDFMDSLRSMTWQHTSASPLAALAFFVAIVFTSTAFSQTPARVTKSAPRAPAKPQFVPEANAQADRRDVILLLDSGPVHLRLHLGLGGVSLAQYRQQFVTKMLKSLDINQDGKLSRDEAHASPLLRTKQRPGAAQFLESLKTQAMFDRRHVEQTIDRYGGEIIAYRQDLSSAANDIEIFKLLDLDQSGVLSESEMAAARELILSKDNDGDECVSFEEFLPLPPPEEMILAVNTPTLTPPPVVVATVAELVRDASEPLLPSRLLRKYDKKRDLQLDAAELGWSAERLAAVDQDGNGKLDATELGRLSAGVPDAELVIDLMAADGTGGKLKVRQSTGKQLDDRSRSDYAKVSLTHSVVTYSIRNVNPIDSAIENAMRQFNQLDTDANGYVDKDETTLRIRFERGLFDLIDEDGDGKIFADEMKAYVRARSEPAATSCRMNLYDTGNGFFMALDANADGRVSVRETRQAMESLAQLNRDGKAGVRKDEPVRHFHIEFTRGGYQLFGPTEQLVAKTPAFQQRRPTGPIWFQRMDRNNDGDLTWNEFLGPREVFHKLDKDVDSLLDPLEAARAE